MTLFAFMLYFLHSCCFFGDFISKLIKYQHQELIPMETLATSVTRFFLQKHYIEPDQADRGRMLLGAGTLLPERRPGTLHRLLPEYYCQAS